MDCLKAIATKYGVSNFALVRALFARGKKLATVGTTKIASMAGSKETKKKSKKSTDEPEPEPVEEEEPESEPEEDEEEDEEGSENEESGGEEEEDEEEDEDEEEIETEGKTPEQIEAEKAARKKKRESKQRFKARRKGYRNVAEKGGFSQHYVTTGAHLDVATPIVSINETIRAAQWAPRIADKEAYDGLSEFEERTKLQHAALPPSAAKAIRTHAEAYIRRLTTASVQRMSDMTRKGVTINMVTAETRPLQRAQKYSFVAPKGLVRWNQKETKTRARLSMYPEDMVDDKSPENASLLKDQEAVAKSLQAKADKEKAERKVDRADAKRLREEAEARGEAPPKKVKKAKVSAVA